VIIKYVAAGMGIALLASGALNMYLNSEIEELLEERGRLVVQVQTCEASNKNLSDGIDVQNRRIKQFNSMLDSKNEVLNEVTKQNNLLQQEISKQVFEISQIQYETCEETMDWMLEEAIDENISTSITTNPIK
jgi:seryl-tRNA synthetase